MQRAPFRKTGFTLIELLVSIGIIAVLLSLLFPVLARARRQAIVTTCFSGQHQFIAAMHAYAQDYEDCLPRFDNYLGAANLSDLPWSFYSMMHGQYGLPKESFFCPAADPALIETYWNIWGDAEICIGYSLWIPHICTGQLVPPLRGQGLTVVSPDSAMRGPVRLGDSTRNPILSDPIYLDTWVPANPATYDMSRASESDFWFNYGGHYWNGKFECATVGWADGHVERRSAADVKIQYCSYNAWSCR